MWKKKLLGNTDQTHNSRLSHQHTMNAMQKRGNANRSCTNSISFVCTEPANATKGTWKPTRKPAKKKQSVRKLHFPLPLPSPSTTFRCFVCLCRMKKFVRRAVDWEREESRERSEERKPVHIHIHPTTTCIAMFWKNLRVIFTWTDHSNLKFYSINDNNQNGGLF